MFTKKVKYQRRLRYAGGYRICLGCPGIPNITRPSLQPWFRAVHKKIKQLIKANDPDTLYMLQEATCEWMTFECRPYHHWTSLTPLEKSQSLIAHLLRRSVPVEEILARGVAGRLWTLYDPRSKRKDSHFIAVQVARSVRFGLRPDWRIYERESLRYPGQIERTEVNIASRVQIGSRYAAQRIEAAIMKHADLFIHRHGVRTAKTILSPQPFAGDTPQLLTPQACE